MPRVNVYLPTELAAEAKRAGLNVSALTQEAIRAALAARATDRWLDERPSAPPTGITHDEVMAALDAVRDEAPTRHG